MFRIKKKKVVKTGPQIIKEVLGEFGKIASSLQDGINCCNTAKEENMIKIEELEKNNLSLQEDIERALNAKNNIEALVGA